jgi:hypothetical protein
VDNERNLKKGRRQMVFKAIRLDESLGEEPSKECLQHSMFRWREMKS